MISGVWACGARALHRRRAAAVEMRWTLHIRPPTRFGASSPTPGARALASARKTVRDAVALVLEELPQTRLSRLRRRNVAAFRLLLGLCPAPPAGRRNRSELTQAPSTQFPFQDRERLRRIPTLMAARWWPQRRRAGVSHTQGE